MADSNFWRDLAAEFRSLPKDDTYAYRVIDGLPWTMPPPISRWMLHSNSVHVAVQFEFLARRGGDALSPNDIVDAFQSWMATLYAYGVNIGTDDLILPSSGGMTSDVVGQTRERISNLSETSALLCGTQAIRAFEAERQARARAQTVSSQANNLTLEPHIPAIIPKIAPPSIAEQLEALRVKADVKQEALAELVRLDVRTVQRHLSGDTKPNKRLIYRYEIEFSKLLKTQIVISKLS